MSRCSPPTAGRRRAFWRGAGGNSFGPRDFVILGGPRPAWAGWGGCNCLVDIPAGSPALEAGTMVKAVLL